MAKTQVPTQGIENPRPSPLNRKSGIPLYHQIQQRLLDQIESGELKPGMPMPSIERIARRMGVSPMTVRQAVRALCELGVIYSRQGKGTFISGIKLERDFRQVLSFTEESVARGARPSSKVLSFEMQGPNPAVKAALRLGPRENVYCLRRVRYGDSVPMGIECSSLPVRLCPGLLETFNPASSLYAELAEQYGIQLMVTDEVIEVGKASAEEARLLEIAPKSPVFLFTRISYLENGVPAEYVNSIYPGSRYKVVNRLMRMNRKLVSSSS
ncbi:MAG TPA: GntR family transcriptional regulator [Terracidiphilus sp.]|nr:GntR family transcriptional regulator [Terracidiphilus sp.]